MAVTRGPLAWRWHVLVALAAGALAVAVGPAAGVVAAIGLWLVLRARGGEPRLVDEAGALSLGVADRAAVQATAGIAALGWWLAARTALAAAGATAPDAVALALAVPVLVDAAVRARTAALERALERDAAFADAVEDARPAPPGGRVVVPWARGRIALSVAGMLLAAAGTAAGGALAGGAVAIVLLAAAAVVVAAAGVLVRDVVRLPGPLVLDEDGCDVLGRGHVAWRRVLDVRVQRVHGVRHLVLVCDRVPPGLRRRARAFGGDVGVPLQWCAGRPQDVVALVRAADAPRA